ncbi:unnamed protein product [Rotaria sp. Silwood1]|nr:unnamed protein product [Rotaria sp. Silwood1]
MSFSKENEIIKIANVSDDSFSTQFDPPAVNQSISASLKATSTLALATSSSSSSSSSKVNYKLYSSKFKKEWLSNSNFSSFLRECKNDPTKALCITCNVQFSIQNSGLGDINHHMQTMKHQESVKSFAANRSKTLDAVFNIPTSELNKLCAAEGTMVFHSVKHSHSYISQACTINVAKKCFSDSSIVKKITCNKTKAREIACNVLAPSLTHSIVLELRDVDFFSICYDTSNKGNIKMLPIVVQFFSKFGVKHGVIDFIEQQHESAEALFTNIKYVLEANDLRLNQLISLGSDNTNVNIGNNHSVFALFQKLVPRLIKGNCYSHILHNSVKHGNNYLLFDVEAALLKIYAHFSKSSVRSKELEKYFDFVEQEQKVILQHIRLRWLSLLASIERLILVYPVVKNYFLNLKDNECPSLLLDFFTSNKIQAANLSLQREYTTGVNLHTIISTLLRKLNNRLKDDFFGSKVDQLLKNIQYSIEVDDLKKSFRLFIRSLIDYIEKYYNNSASFYQSISIFSELDIEKLEWKDIQYCSTFIDDEMIDQDGLYNDFNHIKSKYIELKEKFGGIHNQVQSFISSNLGIPKRVEAPLNNEESICNECDGENSSDSDDEDESHSKCHKDKQRNQLMRSDRLWAYLLDGETVPNLKKLVQFVFAIPASNAFCESVFSHMKYLWNDNRRRMKHDLVGAELKIKMNSHHTCTQFYDYLLNKPDLLKQIRSSDKYSHIAKVPRLV